MKKSSIITFGIVLVVIILAIILIYNEGEVIDEQTAKCIGENSLIYTQIGCHACEIQKEMFGENYKYLNITDCTSERNICIEKGVTATPTWEINSQFYRGVQSIEKLKELTGC